MNNLSPENKQTMDSKYKDADGSIAFRLMAAHRHLARAAGEKLEWLDLGLPTVGEKGSLAKRVLEYLKSQEILLTKIAPRQVLQKTLKDDENEKPMGDIHEAFLKFPHLPMLESEVVLHNAVQDGVRDGLFGLRSDGRIFFGESVPFGVLDTAAVLVRKEVAESQKAAAGAAGTPGLRPRQLSGGAAPGVATEGPQGPASAAGKKVRQLSLRLKLPWDKLADFVRGVLRPLKEDGAEIEVEVALTARSEEGLKKTTLDHKVKETLNQIGAKILDEHQE